MKLDFHYSIDLIHFAVFLRSSDAAVTACGNMSWMNARWSLCNESFTTSRLLWSKIDIGALPQRHTSTAFFRKDNEQKCRWRKKKFHSLKSFYTYKYSRKVWMNEYTLLSNRNFSVLSSFIPHPKNINESKDRLQIKLSCADCEDKRCRNFNWHLFRLRLHSRHHKPGNWKPQTKNSSIYFNQPSTTMTQLDSAVWRISPLLPAAKWLNQSPSHSLILMIICHSLTSHDVPALSRNIFSCDYVCSNIWSRLLSRR